jgi:hypothetical protein
VPPMVPMLLAPFATFREEGRFIGRLLLAYGEIENALCSCVAMARGDMDAVIKAMYRPRGEGARVDIADALGRAPYKKHGLETQFSEAIGGVRRCLKIRNQFAHCNWHDDNTGRLSFIDMQEIAEGNAVIADLSHLTLRYLDVPLLLQQEAFFAYVANLLVFLNFEGQKLAGRISSHPYAAPPKVPPPPPYLP